MKVEWVKQVKTDTAAEALDLAMAKWWFFAHCTWEQLTNTREVSVILCALCMYYEQCKVCTFDPYCADLFCKASSLYTRARGHKDALPQFHAAARKVYDKLKSLRGKV